MLMMTTYFNIRRVQVETVAYLITFFFIKSTCILLTVHGLFRNMYDFMGLASLGVITGDSVIYL